MLLVKKLNAIGGVSVAIIVANNILLRIMCGSRDSFLCGTIGDRVPLLANHQSLHYSVCIIIMQLTSILHVNIVSACMRK